MPDAGQVGDAAPTRSTGRGFGRLLVAVYGIFALAATARSFVQIATRFDEAPVAYLLSAFSALVYVVAMVAVFFHLTHGIQSLFQTSGFSNAVMLPRYGIVGKLLSAVFLLGFGSIPVVILLQILK